MQACRQRRLLTLRASLQVTGWRARPSDRRACGTSSRNFVFHTKVNIWYADSSSTLKTLRHPQLD
eukprot:1615791-Prymnesium_polylepis.1